MKWSSGILIFALVLSCESLGDLSCESLNDLKKIDFGRSVPKHSLLLLHWFANVIDIDNNDVLLLTFDPNIEDFGSHHYGNYEDMLDPLPQGYRYYTVGNLYEPTSNELPQYVLQPPDREYKGNNMDRIVFRVQERNSRVHQIDQVYLTQHYRQDEHQGTRYNPEHTYHISPMLLHEIRLFSVDNPRSLRELRDIFHIDAGDLWDISNLWGKKLTCLGLLLFIVIQEKYSAIVRPRQQQSDQNNPKPEEGDDTFAQSHFDSNVLNDRNEANILLHGQSLALTDKNEWHQVEQDTTLISVVKVSIVNNNRNQRAEETRDHLVETETYVGTVDSSMPQDAGQDWTRVVTVVVSLIFLTVVLFNHIVQFLNTGEEVCQHPHFGKVQIPGHDAHLELVANQHKACARLYVKQDFRQQKSEFEQSWVGFYKSAQKDTSQYEWGQWQWATKFTSCSDFEDYNGYCLEYCSGMKASPGVQARFILKDNREIAHTPSFQSPDGVEITGYNAHLQFFVTNGKACARLYVRKSFRHWRSEFKESWVGFYKSVSAGTSENEWWQWEWATEFKQCNGGSWWDYQIFEYCSGVKANPGVHVRFILKGAIEIARTPNWQYFN